MKNQHSLDSSESESRIPVAVCLGWMLVLAALLYAGLFATGMVLPRLALSMPLLVTGSVLCVFGEKADRASGSSAIWVVIVVVGGYFIVRGCYSPVWDLARKDIFLVGGGILTCFSAAIAMRYRVGRGCFLGLLIALLVVHFSISAYQYLGDSSYAFFYGSRSDVKGVSGTYYHRNYLAGFLSLIGPVFLAAALGFRERKSPLKWVLLVLFCGIVFLSFQTTSRGGFGCLVLAVVVTAFYCLNLDGLTARRKFLLAAFFLIFATLFLLGSWLMFQSILDQREGFDGSFQGRLNLAGIAFELWSESPLFGQGSRSYSYLFPTHFEGLGGWYGNARFAHTDYIQTLSDYGLVGAIGVAVLVLTFGWVILASRSTVSAKNRWLLAAGAGVLVGETVRASFDFNLHILANMLFFAAILGGTIGALPLKKPKSGTDEKRVPLDWVLKVILVFIFGSICFWCSRLETAAAPEWIAVETARARGESGIEEIRAYTKKAPYFEGWRTLGRASLAKQVNGKASTKELKRTRDNWKNAVESHPRDGESLASYGRALDDLSLFSEAEGYHLKAMNAVVKRENKYGVVFGVGWHLAKRGEAARSARKPGEALYLFREAEAAFDESYRLNYSRKIERPASIAWLKSRIDFLEGARIEQEVVSVLDWRSQLP